MNKLLRNTAVVAAALMASSTVSADDLTMGLTGLTSSMDPHFHNVGTNHQVLNHVYDRLVDMDDSQRVIPDLAESWGPIDSNTWEFKLRKGVTWHDGSPFNADDVLFTMERAQDVPNSPSSFGTYIKGKTFIKVDDHTIHVKTETPYPLMPNDLSNILIVSRKHGEGATTEDYNTGKAAIGTGPYKFVSHRPGAETVFEAVEGHYSGSGTYDRVVMKEIKSGQARVAALLAGDVDVINQVPTVDVARLEKDDNVSVTSGVSNRVIYLHLTRKVEYDPAFTDADGNPLGKNPLHDLKVRQAISKAINRNAIRDRIMEGLSIPAGQLLPEGFFAHSPNLKPEAYDPDGAKKLLADAGYPNGFGITLHGPNNRYVNDAKIVEATAQMLTRIGVKTKVQTEPRATYFKNAWNYPFILVGWGSGTGEPSSPLRALLATRDKATGMGGTNRGGYSNPELDAVIKQALAEVNDDARAKLLQKATEMAIGDLGIIPIHYQVNSWATRKGLTYKPRSDERTMAMNVVKLTN